MGGVWQDILNSDDVKYGGSGVTTGAKKVWSPMNGSPKGATIQRRLRIPSAITI